MLALLSSSVPVSTTDVVFSAGNVTSSICAAEDELGPEDELFWIYVGIICALVIFAGTMSGLTLGLLSLDVMSLRVLIEAGNDKDRKHAKRILPLVKRHHLLLVTLLLADAAASEALPLFLDRLSNPIMAVIISVTVVLIFGEVIPQALCSRYGLSIGAFLSPLVYLLMVVLIPVAYPFSKLLDFILGDDHKTFFRRAELKALVGLHGPAPLLTERIQSVIESADEEAAENYQRLHNRSDSMVSARSVMIGNEDPLSYDEVLIIKGALEMRDKTAADALVPIEHTFMLDADRILDENTLAEIEQSHHSRIPLYENGSRDHIIGCLLVRCLIQLGPADKVPIRRLFGTRAFRELLHVDKRMPLYELLSELKTGRSNMAIIHEAADDELLGNQAAQEAAYEASQISTTRSNRVRAKRRSTFKLMPSTRSLVLGIVSLEDIIEELLQEEILDEMDFEVAHSLKVKDVTEACRETMTALSGTVNHIRRLRHAGRSLISREFTTIDGGASSKTMPTPVSGLGRSVSANILLARSASRTPSSNRVSRRITWRDSQCDSVRKDDVGMLKEEEEEVGEMFDAATANDPAKQGSHANFISVPRPPPEVVFTASSLPDQQQAGQAPASTASTASDTVDDMYEGQYDDDKRWLFSTK